MNKKENLLKLFDHISISLQSIYKSEEDKRENPLINIDFREEKEKSPFLYDTANKILHERGCSLIDQDTSPSHFAIWHIKDEDLNLACKRCKPSQKRSLQVNKEFLSDITYGVLSLLDQFGSALIEKGKEYKKSKKGKDVSRSLDNLFSGLDQSQKKIVDTTIISLDKMIGTLQTYNENLKAESGNGNGNKSKKTQTTDKPKRSSQRRSKSIPKDNR